MGAYINPPNQSKEEFLNRHGELIEGGSPDSYRNEDKLAVCLVDNGPFTAAGIAFNPRELKAFSNPDDMRPKKWYWVEEDKLHEVSDELERYQSAVE